MKKYQEAKKTVRDFYKAFDGAPMENMEEVLQRFTTDGYHWRGMHPFYEQFGARSVVDGFWHPLRKAFSPMQRREDIFFAGANDCDDGKSTWVVSVGNFLGLFDRPWLDIPPTGKMVFLRYAEFHRVNEAGKIEETAFFCDILSVMHQAGQYPLPPMTGAAFLYPGPRTHDGLLFKVQPEEEGIRTLQVLNSMIDDLDALNKSGSFGCPPEVLERTWKYDMVWYGPFGIGASYTIPRYQKQHQLPFRRNLENKVFNGHIARVAEGCYCGFFGWPNLNNQNRGGFLGLPQSDTHAPMRVVDIYRREGDKLAENWVFIDMLHYLFEQGLDVLGRMRELNTIG